MSDKLSSARHWWPLGTAALYLVFGITWIYLSDNALLGFTRDPETIIHFEQLKGILFVLISTAIIGTLEYAHHVGKRQRERSTAHFRNVFEATPAGIVLLDAHLRVIESNPAFCRLLRRNAEDIVGRRFADFLSGFAASTQELERRLRTGVQSVDDLELDMLRSDGTHLIVRVFPANLLPPGDQYMLIAEDETRHRGYERRLEQYAATLEQLSKRQLEMLEEERREISRELHDEVGQLLTAIRLRIDNALATSEREPRTKQLRDAGEETGRVLDIVRDLSRTLRPTILDDFGLAAALQWLCDSLLSALQERPGVVIDVEELEPRPHAVIETACFRIAQEALTNVIKYAGAKRVEVLLYVQNNGVVLEVIDDGDGFDVDAAEALAARGESLGVIGMRERAMLAGGRLEIRSQPGTGTCVHAWLPTTPNRTLETGAHR